MSRCSHSGFGTQCRQPVSQISQLGLCITHEQEAWAWLNMDAETRRAVSPCPNCRKNASTSRKAGWCDSCVKQEKDEKRKVKS